jgi:hypothetical protein
VSGGGLSLLGQRSTDFAGTLSMPGGASFDLPFTMNPPGSEVSRLLGRHVQANTSKRHILSTQVYDMVAVVSDVDPFKYAESNQTANSTGKVSISGSVSLKFSSPVTGAVTVTNLSIPILITIPHPPMPDNETVECRYWDPILLEQRTDGCELVASFSNYSVCACDHLTDFSIGFFGKFSLEVTLLHFFSFPPSSGYFSIPIPCSCRRTSRIQKLRSCYRL